MSDVASPNSVENVRSGKTAIPVRNVWLLMLYASDLCRHHRAAGIDAEEMPDEIADVVAKVLVDNVRRRFRRNLSYDYRRRNDVLPRVRGRIDILQTERKRLLELGRVACSFDELTIDSTLNRFVHAALLRAARLVHDSGIGRECRSAATTFERLGVASIVPHRSEVDAIRIPPHCREDRMMIAAAKLIFDFLMPTETAGNVSLYRPERDVIWLRWLFQRAVYGFYRYHLSGHDWKIEWEKRLDWPIGERSKHLSRHMPKMRADIVLENRHEGKRIVIDTKFKNIFGIGQYGRKRFHSSNIYQLYAYLLSQVSPDDPLSLHSEGILLYPVVDAAIDEWAEIQGHRFRFATVNLADSVAQIQKRLLSIIQPEVVTR